jgi:hypothetical protein
MVKKSEAKRKRRTDGQPQAFECVQNTAGYK